MKRLPKFCSLTTFLCIISGIVLIAEQARSESLPLWREGAKGYADPELERLDRAFTALAEKIRPAVVQIRTIRGASNDAKDDAPRSEILAVNGIEVDSPRELTRLVGGVEAGAKVSLTIFRKGQILHSPVILRPIPKEAAGRQG